VLLVAIGLVVTGFLVIRKITTIDI
jgi:hypothetical protein